MKSTPSVCKCLAEPKGIVTLLEAAELEATCFPTFPAATIVPKLTAAEDGSREFPGRSELSDGCSVSENGIRIFRRSSQSVAFRFRE